MTTMEVHLTSTEVAALLGVSPSTVKRWADDGVLECVRTIGSHRRFTRDAIERLRHRQAGVTSSVDAAPMLAGWAEELLVAGTTHPLEARLLALRARLGSWWAVCGELAVVIRQIGIDWAEGRLSILEEHQATERLARGLQRVGEWLPTTPASSSALLATAEGDEHTLGLACVELCLRELGFTVRWAGRSLPNAELIRGLLAPVHLVAVSASQLDRDPAELEAQAEALGVACRRAGITLILGGEGAWPTPPRFGHRLRDFKSLHELARQLVL